MRRNIIIRSLFVFIECGISYNEPNVKILGGITSVPYSWPAQVLIVQNIKHYVDILSRTYLITAAFSCGGTIINRYTVLTAAHCLNKIYTTGYTSIPLEPNEFFPTYESMFDIYVGIFDKSFLNTTKIPPTPGKKMSVKKAISVVMLNLIFIY